MNTFKRHFYSLVRKEFNTRWRRFGDCKICYFVYVKNKLFLGVSFNPPNKVFTKKTFPVII